MTNYSCEDLIVGGGMQGIMAARAGVRAGRDCILIDKADGVGGILRPRMIDGVSVDPGCHIWGAQETLNLNFMEDDLGIALEPVLGHCEASLTLGDSIARHLSTPTFESLPEHVRMEAADRARMHSADEIAGVPMGELWSAAFGAEISGMLMQMATRLYGRDPHDLALCAATQMGMSRLKLHTCDELRNMVGESLGPLLCSHPLDTKREAVTKFMYPRGGLGQFLERVASWLSGHVQAVHTNCNVRGLEIHADGGVVRTPDAEFRFERLLWCCNPLALAGHLGIETPVKAAVAGSPWRSFFYTCSQTDIAVEYTHDFRIASPMFRSWSPPACMSTQIDRRRWVIVECPGVGETDETVAQVGREIERLHRVPEGSCKFIASQAQVRFYPTCTYMSWLRDLSDSCETLARPVALPPVPLYGKDVIAQWWSDAVVGIGNSDD
ncbi:MAG: FAD-dependent oxidoreductase [Phycisphaerales bacterium]|nr:FAD-dependent oxidoreductase [Phycisphaerales bacterium]